MTLSKVEWVTRVPVILSNAKDLGRDSSLRYAEPALERKSQMLRFAQHDRKRRVQNDNINNWEI
jgi:hypothetical protein